MLLAAAGSVGRTGRKCCRFGQGESTGWLRAGRLHSPVTALLTNCGDGPNPTRERAALGAFGINLMFVRLTPNAPFFRRRPGIVAPGNRQDAEPNARHAAQVGRSSGAEGGCGVGCGIIERAGIVEGPLYSGFSLGLFNSFDSGVS
jgi:hypothetical protein